MSDAWFSATYPKARKEHRCDQCGRSIGKGEVYRRQGMIYDGRMSAALCCLQCEWYAQALYLLGFEGDEGGWAWLPDVDSGEVAYCGMGDEAQLFRRKWRTDDGSLWPVPEPRGSST